MKNRFFYFGIFAIFSTIGILFLLRQDPINTDTAGTTTHREKETRKQKELNLKISSEKRKSTLAEYQTYLSSNEIESINKFVGVSRSYVVNDLSERGQKIISDTPYRHGMIAVLKEDGDIGKFEVGPNGVRGND